MSGAARGVCDANCHLHGQGDSFHVATCAAEIARDQLAAALADEHETTYSQPHPDLFRADCSCGWVRASPDRGAVEAAVDGHEDATGDGIDWAEVARADREEA